MKKQKKINVEKFQDSFSFVQNIREDFLKDIKEKLRQTTSFQVSHIINVRLSPEEEVDSFMKSHNITDNSLLKELELKTICNIVEVSYEIQGVKAFVFFYLVDFHDYRYNYRKYKIFSATLTCPELFMFDEILDISELGRKKIYYVQKIENANFTLLHIIKTI